MRDTQDVKFKCQTVSCGNRSWDIYDPNSPTSATALRVYNTCTDASNGEWGALDWQTTPNVLTIGTQKNGTGANRGVQFTGGGTPATNFMDYAVSAPQAR